MDSFNEDIATIVVALFDIFATQHHPGQASIDAYNRVADDLGHLSPNNTFRTPGVSRFEETTEPEIVPLKAESEELDDTEEAEQE